MQPPDLPNTTVHIHTHDSLRYTPLQEPSFGWILDTLRPKMYHVSVSRICIRITFYFPRSRSHLSLTVHVVVRIVPFLTKASIRSKRPSNVKGCSFWSGRAEWVRKSLSPAAKGVVFVSSRNASLFLNSCPPQPMRPTAQTNNTILETVRLAQGNVGKF